MPYVKEKKLSKIKYKNLLSHLTIIISIFIIDRISKIYLLDLLEKGTEVDFYIFPFLNIFLAWNTGIGFGLFSFDKSLIYKFITYLILALNIIIIIMIYRTNDYRVYFLLLILGGALGNLFDRLYYFAVPDFIDFHINNFHWFIFNVSDIFISIGIFCLIITEIFLKKKNENEKK